MARRAPELAGKGSSPFSAWLVVGVIENGSVGLKYNEINQLTNLGLHGVGLMHLVLGQKMNQNCIKNLLIFFKLKKNNYSLNSLLLFRIIC